MSEKKFREVSRNSNHAGPLEEADMEKILQENIFGVFSCITENGYPMTVPVHYIYYQGSLYLHTSNKGEKVDSIRTNNQVSFLVCQKRDPDDPSPYTMYDSVLVYGRACILDPATDEEARAALKEMSLHCGMPQKATDDYLDHFLGRYVAVKITPDHVSGRYLHVH